MAENIDTNRLHVDLRYRFDYLSQFLEFSQIDINILNQLSIVIQPLIPVIVDDIYRKLFSFDLTQNYLLLHHSCIKSFSSIDGFYSEDMDYSKNMLSKYLKYVLTRQKWTDSFLRYLSNVGKIHKNSINSTNSHIDYIHIAALSGYLEQNLINIISKSDSFDLPTKHAGIKAINKFFWIQNDFFRMHYDNN